MDTSVNVCLINFICMIVMFLVNYVFIVILNGLECEADYQIITPQDYTLMISDVDPTFKSDEELKDMLEVLAIKPLHVNRTYKLHDYINKKIEFKNLLQILNYMEINEVNFFYIIIIILYLNRPMYKTVGAVEKM